MHDPSLHLFVDDHHVRARFAMRREPGVLERFAEPLLGDIPDRQIAWGCVLREADGRFRLWYQSVFERRPREIHEAVAAGAWGRGDEFGYFPERWPGIPRETQTSVVSYAESGDGIAWTRPDLGIVPWQGSTANNIVLDGSGAARQFDGALTNMDTVSVLRDGDDPDPARRYKLISHWETIHVWDNRVSGLGRSEAFMERAWAARAKYMVCSPDGIRWDGPLLRVKECAGGGDYGGVTRDERNRVYWFNDRANPGVPDVWHRAVGLCTSPDLEQWPDTVDMVFHPAGFEDYGMRYEHHGMTPFNYGDQDLCALECSLRGQPVLSLLGSHRDGQPWQRANGDTPLLSVGPPGTFDCNIMALTRNPPWRVGDRLLFHYNGRGFPRDPERREGFLCGASMRLDGFCGMAVDAAAQRRHGVAPALVTRPIVVREPELQINIVGHRGTARVALLDPAMRPIEGHGMDECQPIAEDAVRAPVRWREREGIANLIGRPVVVVVQMQAGTVFALRF